MSETQPQKETGKSSIELLEAILRQGQGTQTPETETRTKKKRTLKERWYEFLGNRKALYDLIMAEDLRRGMRRESDLAWKDANAYHAAIHGPRGKDRTKGYAEDGDMGHIVLGDMITEHHFPSPEKSLLRKAIPFIATAALTAAGVWFLAPSDDDKPIIQEPEPTQPDVPPNDVDTELGVRVGR